MKNLGTTVGFTCINVFYMVLQFHIHYLWFLSLVFLSQMAG